MKHIFKTMLLASAALLVVSNDMAPLTLRIDHHKEPLNALAKLLEMTREDGYREWVGTVPTANRPNQYMVKPGPAPARTGTS